MSGLGYAGPGSTVRDGFSLKLAKDIFLYGIAPDGVVRILGLHTSPGEGVSAGIIDSLAKLSNDLDLHLVHWCRCVAAQGGVRVEGLDKELFSIPKPLPETVEALTKLLVALRKE